MEALFATDDSFFIITPNPLTNLEKNITHDVISFDVTEENGKMVEGSLQLYDPDGIYAYNLRMGSQFNLTWGYKKPLENYAKLEMLAGNPQEVTNSGIRAGVQCVVTNPGGSGANNGLRTFNCSFYGMEFYNSLKDHIVWAAQNKYLVIQQVMQKIGVSLPNCFINFNTQTDVLNSNTYIRQEETDFKFLVRLSFEWHCVFRVGYLPSGQLTAIFTDNANIGKTYVNNWCNIVTGSFGTSKLFEYGMNSHKANVIDYNWQWNVGNCGQGDGTTITLVGGQVITQSYLVDPQTGKGLVLNEKRVNDYAQSKDSDINTLIDVFSRNGLDETLKNGQKVRSFFDEVESSTAPQGLGYSVSLNCIGETTLTPLVLSTFGAGFPPQLTTNKPLNQFYIKKCTHRLSSEGYRCAVEIADSVTLFGGFVS